MSIGSRIKELRENKNISRNDFATMIGVTVGAISNYENDVSSPKEPILFKIIEALECEPNYIFQDMVRIKTQNNDVTLAEYEHIKKYRFISEYSPDGASVVDMVLDREHAIAEKLRKQSGQIQKIDVETAEKFVPKRIISYYQKLASAGNGEYLFDGIPTDLIEVVDTEIAREADFVIGVNGHSMEPTYCNGEKVFVKKIPDIATGEIGIFLKGNECYIKELGIDRLISHNADKNTYPDIPANESIILVGKVLGKANV